jgi:hypothetical protein
MYQQNQQQQLDTSGIKLTQAANYMGVQNTIGFKMNEAEPVSQYGNNQN